MEKVEGLKIQEATYDLPGGQKGKIAVFFYPGPMNPKPILEKAVREYVEDHGYIELIDSRMNNPWMRVVVSGINNMKQYEFEPEEHKLVSA